MEANLEQARLTLFFKDQRKGKFTVDASLVEKTKDLLDEAQDTAL